MNTPEPVSPEPVNSRDCLFCQEPFDPNESKAHDYLHYCSENCEFEDKENSPDEYSRNGVSRADFL